MRKWLFMAIAVVSCLSANEGELKIMGIVKSDDDCYLALSNDTYWNVVCFETRQLGWIEWALGKEIVTSSYVVPVEKWYQGDYVKVFDKKDYLEKDEIWESNALNQDQLKTYLFVLYNCNKDAVLFASPMEKSEFIDRLIGQAEEEGNKEGLYAGYLEGLDLGHSRIEDQWNELESERTKVYRENYEIGRNQGLEEGEQEGELEAKAEKEREHRRMLDRKYRDGYDSGFKDGYAKGLEWMDESDLFERQERIHKKYDQGYRDGKRDGYNQGAEERSKEIYAEGWNAGYIDGNKIGYEEGFRDREEIILEQGHQAGYQEGYEEGHSEGLDQADRNRSQIFEGGRVVGYREGFTKGYEYGDNERRKEIYAEGHESGFREGYRDGYAEGFEGEEGSAMTRGEGVPEGEPGSY